MRHLRLLLAVVLLAATGLAQTRSGISIQLQDEDGVTTAYPFAPGTYDVQVTFQDSLQTARSRRVDSGAVWVSLYFKPSRNPEREQRTGIRVYKKWEKKQLKEPIKQNGA